MPECYVLSGRKVSATGLTLVQISPTECVCVCVREREREREKQRGVKEPHRGGLGSLRLSNHDKNKTTQMNLLHTDTINLLHIDTIKQEDSEKYRYKKYIQIQ